jgi:RimJ/RimL family protein N-acetyltransferase
MMAMTPGVEISHRSDAEIIRFVERNMGDNFRSFQNSAAIGVELDGELIAGVVYSNFMPESGVVEMSVFANNPRWLSRRTLTIFFAFPFDDPRMNCQMVLLRVSERNARMRRLAQGIGFTEFRIPRLLGRDEDGMIYTMTVEQWRSSKYMRSEIEQELSAHAA